MTERIGRLLLFAAIMGGGILTQRVVAATAIAVEQIERTDSALADLAATINSMSASLSRLVSLSETELDAWANDFNAAFDRTFVRLGAHESRFASTTHHVEEPAGNRPASRSSGEIDFNVIEVDRRAFVRAVTMAATEQPMPYHARGQREIELRARKLAGAILGQRELIELAKSRTLFHAEMMVTLSSMAAMLLMAYLIWRPVVAARAAQTQSRWFTPLFAR